MKKTVFVSFFLCLISLTSYSLSNSDQQEIDSSGNWVSYTLVDGVRIDYRLAPCTGERLTNHMNVWFRFKNETNKSLKISWSTKYYRDNECSNCTRIDSEEYYHEIVIKPGEELTPDESKMDDDTFFLFSHFIKKSPGMSDTILTDFEFANLTIEPIISK